MHLKAIHQKCSGCGTCRLACAIAKLLFDELPAGIDPFSPQNLLIDELGIDTISAGAVVSWAIECFEKGLIPETRIGRPIAFADLPSIDSQHTRPLFDALGVCRLQYMELGFEEHNYETLFQRITGRKLTWDDMLGISERIWNLTRVISIREIPGFGRSWDYPPPRFSSEPIPDGPNAGYFLCQEKLNQLLDWYYEARGWDQDGIPTRATLLRCGLPEAAEAIGAI